MDTVTVISKHLSTTKVDAVTNTVAAIANAE